MEAPAARGGLRIAEHDAYLLAQLVDEDAGGLCLVDGSSQLTQGLAHQAGLQADLVVTHVAFKLSFWCQGSHGVDDDDIYGSAANELVGNVEGLLSVVGLRDKEIIDVHAQVSSIEAVEGMFRIDECSDAALLLSFSNGM